MAGDGPCSKTPKRALSSDPVDEVGAISDDDIQSLLKEHTAAHEAANHKLLADVAVLVDKKTAKLERTQLQHAERLGSLEDKQSLLEKRQDDQSRLVEQLSNQLQTARRQTISRQDVVDDRFDAPPNVEVVVVSCKQFVTIEAVKGAIAKFMGETVGIDEDMWELVRAVPAGKRFLIKFNNLPLGNARLAEKVFTSLRDSNGVWREFFVSSADNAQHQIRLDRHENPKERTQRIMGAMVKRAILTAHPTVANVHSRKDRKLDTVLVYAGPGKGTPICSMVPESSDIEQKFFHWNYEGIEDLELNKEAIVTAIGKDQRRDLDNITFRV